MSDSDTRLADAEHHYDEPDDCFSRHLESKFAKSALHVVVNADGERRLLFGDRPDQHVEWVRLGAKHHAA